MARQFSLYEKQCARVVGAAVQKERKRRGISRAKMAGWINHTTDAVAKAERGERRFSIADLIRLSLEFDCKLEELIFGGERPLLKNSSRILFSKVR